MKILSLILALILGVITYPASYISFNADTDFTINCSPFAEESVFLNGKYEEITLNENCQVNEDGQLILEDKVTLEINKSFFSWFNYYGIAYASDSYIKGEICYRAGLKIKTEEFFLEPSEAVTNFYSFIDNCLSGTKALSIKSISFEPLDTQTAKITINGISLFNRAIPSKQIYIESESVKIGVDLLWGGALSYFEDLDSNVQAVEVDGHIYVDSNAAERYSAKSVNNNVNLINKNDTGRLVQQSYYGTAGGDYECAYYGENEWSYNPVQGGNQYNDNSKIVDIKIEDNLIYIKCRPLDWAKEKEYITPSYMEAYYTIENNLLHVLCRFVDFSGYEETVRTQEIPAFYCIEPLNNFVYYAGNEAWTDGELTYVTDLIFWPDAGYPRYNSVENWSAFVGEFEDSFGIGLYVPNESDFLTGVYSRGNTTNVSPDEDYPTSYIAVTKDMIFKSFSPFEYDYYITTGNVTEIRNTFKTINN